MFIELKQVGNIGQNRLFLEASSIFAVQEQIPQLKDKPCCYVYVKTQNQTDDLPYFCVIETAEEIMRKLDQSLS